MQNAIAATLNPQSLIQSLNSRYAVKKFAAGKKIEPRAWEALEEALRLSPSSFGLQPWKFFVVDSPALREKLLPASWGQKQIIDADKLVVFAVKMGFGAADVEKFIASAAKTRGVAPATMEGYKQVMLGFIKDKPQAAVDAWTARQAYIALGVFLTGAAALGVDACPMEGLEPAKYDDILGLAAKGYTTLFAAAAGVRADDDAYASATKVRFAKHEVIEHL